MFLADKLNQITQLTFSQLQAQCEVGAGSVHVHAAAAGVDVIGTRQVRLVYARRCDADGTYRPLADRLRPRSLDEYVGQIASAGRGRAAAPRARIGPSAFDDLVGAAGHRQNHLGAPGGQRRAGGVHRALGGAGRHQGHPRRRGAGAGAARHARHRAVPGRGASLQQVAAGHLPALRRGRHADLRRRHHREPVLRGQQRAAVAGARVRAEVARRRGSREIARSGLDRSRARLGRVESADRRRRRANCCWRPPTAMRGAC